jgi:5-methylcytosine-specific restriction endonuclease McrA
MTRLRTAPPKLLRPPRRRPAPYDRATVLARWPECCYCSAPSTELDHVHPIALGGRDRESNVVGVCAPHNHAKGAKSLAEWALLD